MKQLSYIVIFAVIGTMVYLTLNQTAKSSRSFEFTYKVDLEGDNNSETIMKTWIPIPQSINNVQTISNEKLTYNKDELDCELLTEEVHKNKYYYCEAKNNEIEKASLIFTCDVERKEHKKVNLDINPDIYKEANNMVPVGAPKFAKVISKGELNGTDIKKIYNYVLTGMHYGKPTDDENSDNYKYINGGKNPNTGLEWLTNDTTYGELNIEKDDLVASQNKDTNYAYGNGNADYACDIGVGNCTDYHSYFMSLCRTLDVPARFHMGFNIPPDDTEDGEGAVKGYHCWADYYKEDANGQGAWYPVDISEADKAPNKADYFFGTLDKNRVEFTTGRDLVLKGRDPESPENFFIYPLFEGTKKMKKGKNYSFKYKNI